MIISRHEPGCALQRCLKLSHKGEEKNICLFVRKRRHFCGRCSFLACLASLFYGFCCRRSASEQFKCTIVSASFPLSDVSIATVRMLLAFQLLAGASRCCMERLKSSTFPHLLTFHSIRPVIKWKKTPHPLPGRATGATFFFLPEKPKICPWSAWKVEPWRQHRR